MTLDKKIAELRHREHKCWEMAKVFWDNLDAHGIMDMGAEIQALERTRKEFEKLASGDDGAS